MVYKCNYIYVPTQVHPKIWFVSLRHWASPCILSQTQCLVLSIRTSPDGTGHIFVRRISNYGAHTKVKRCTFFHIITLFSYSTRLSWLIRPCDAKLFLFIKIIFIFSVNRIAHPQCYKAVSNKRVFFFQQRASVNCSVGTILSVGRELICLIIRIVKIWLRVKLIW